MGKALEGFGQANVDHKKVTLNATVTDNKLESPQQMCNLCISELDGKGENREKSQIIHRQMMFLVMIDKVTLNLASVKASCVAQQLWSSDKTHKSMNP